MVGRMLGATIVIGAAIMVMNYDSLFGQLKFFWEWGVVFSSPFWMGILWRRTNRYSVWFAIMGTFILFFLIPALLPAVSPDLRTNSYLLKQTNPRVVERVYTARPVDVQERSLIISDWERLYALGKSVGPRPETLSEGDEFIKTYKLPQKSVFWTQGISVQDDNTLKGEGMLSVELIFYDRLGFDLSNNSYALNETLRILTRTIVPFLFIVLISMFFKHPVSEAAGLDRFYVKMKTKVRDNREEDEEELEKSYKNPDRFNHRLMFPGTQWEILKWNREDAMGFGAALLMVVGILVFLYVAVNLGGKIDF